MNKEQITSKDEFAELKIRQENIEKWARDNLDFEQAIKMLALHKAASEQLLECAHRSTRITEQKLTELREKLDEKGALVDALNDSLKLNMALPAMLEEAHRNAFDEGKSAIPKQNAMKRHAEHHAMKVDVFKWLDSNFDNCKSMDSAAEMMAGKLVPAKFRTVRGWVTEWKKLHPASTP